MLTFVLKKLNSGLVCLTFVRSPQPFHSVPHQGHSRQLDEALGNVEVDERGNLEEPHRVLLGVFLRLRGVNLPLECQVEAVSHENLGNSGRVLG